MTFKIACIGGKGGVGKTVSTVNIGGALKHFGKNTIVVDGNITTPNLGLHLGSAIFPVTLHDVLKNKNDINESIYKHKSGLRVIPSSIATNALINVDPRRLKTKLKGLDGLADYVIIDGSAGLGRESLAVIEAADAVLIITNPELSAVTDALKTIKLSEKLGRPVLGVVLNKFRNDNREMSIEEVENLLGKIVLGTVPEDEIVREAILKKNSVVKLFPKSEVAISYKKIVSSLINEPYFEDVKEKGWFDEFLEKLGFR